jgi:putative redox protein
MAAGETLGVTVYWTPPRRFAGLGPVGAPVAMDSRPEHAGEATGPTPMETVLIALAGCTGMDVAGILEKMRAPLASLAVSVSGDRAATHPKAFTRIHIRYEAGGPGLTHEQVDRAVRLSHEKYCPVAAMLRPAVAITHEVVLAGAEGVRLAG